MAQALTATTVGQIEGLIEDQRVVHDQIVETRKLLDPGEQKAVFDDLMARLDAMATSDGDQNVFNIARLLIGRSDASAVIRAAAIKEEIASVETGFAGLLDQMAAAAREAMTTTSRSERHTSE